MQTEYDNLDIKEIEAKQNRVTELIHFCDEAAKQGDKDKDLDYLLEANELSSELFEQVKENIVNLSPEFAGVF